jgi:hypothetical protein
MIQGAESAYPFDGTTLEMAFKPERGPWAVDTLNIFSQGWILFHKFSMVFNSGYLTLSVNNLNTFCRIEDNIIASTNSHPETT